MKYFDHARAGASRGRILCGSLLLACVFLPASTAARQAATTAPAAPQAPAADAPAAATPAARPPQTTSPRAPRVNVSPRSPRTTPAPAAVPSAAPQAPAAPPRPTAAPVPPREVVTVVHRLSGWKLLAWLATNGPHGLELDELPSMKDSHTNVVAGYIYDGGRTVVARLAQSALDLESFTTPATPPGLFAQTGAPAAPEPEYLLITSEGRRVEARFVGLDSSTGLTLLEAKERLLSGAAAGVEGHTEDPTVGQRVQLYAPAPAGSRAAANAPQAAPGYINLSIDQKEGLLTQVRRAPSGSPSRFVVSADVSQAWAGAVAANELGEVVGIVSQSRGGETHLVPMATVRSACERVLKLRGSAPQPWLGARGEEAYKASLEKWVGFNWTPELARPLIEKRQGVILTAVAPGTPAALAGLKPGDLIAGVGARELLGVEDLSFTLKEAGVGSTIDLTVWRALEPAPLKVSVELKGAKNPALATAVAEQRAEHASLSTLAREVSKLEAELQVLTGRAASSSDAEKAAQLAARLKVLRLELKSGSERLTAAAARVAAARRQTDWPAYGWQSLEMPFPSATPLQFMGLNTINLTPRGASRFGAKGGTLVVAVLPESPAAASGLHVGDVIETVNGRPFVRTELPRLLAAPNASAFTFGLVRHGRRLTVSFTPSPGGEPQQKR